MPRRKKSVETGTLADGRADRRKIDLSAALKMRLVQGRTLKDIGEAMGGASKQSVHKALKPFMKLIDQPEATRAFREVRAEILDAALLKVVQQIVDPAKLNKAGLGALAFTGRQLFDMGRLARGESTSNIGLRASLVFEAHSDLAELLRGPQSTRPTDAMPGPSDGSGPPEPVASELIRTVGS
jgi:hypothetical protein